jgi:hypothetical protein
MAKASQLTLDLKAIVTTVAGKKPNEVFNDKRKSGDRRYKFSGIFNLSVEQMETIKKTISTQHPDSQFDLVNMSNHGGGCSCCGGYYNGLTVFVK